RKELQEDLEILRLREELLDSDHGDQRVRQRHAEAAVALGLDDADTPGLGDGEVRAADRNAGLEELPAQVLPRGGRELTRFGGEVRQAELAAEQVPDLDAVLVDRGDEDVRRLLAGQLADQLREIGLDDVDSGVCEAVVEADLVGRKRLDLDDLANAGRLDEDCDHAPRLSRVARPVDAATRALDRLLELDQV